MGNLISYIQTVGDRTLAELPFNDVDNFVLSYLVYYEFDNIVPRPRDRKRITVRSAAKRYALKHGDSQTNVDPALLALAGESRRFGGALLSSYVNVFRKGETQFTGLRITFRNGTDAVVFRGVDGTLTGWQEAFRASYRVTPAQQMAACYLQRILEADPNASLITGGHSKGGNLALHAAASLPEELQKRITRIYLNDSPELTPELCDESGYARIADRVRRIVPQFSVIGEIFSRGEPDVIVRGNLPGIHQHEPLNWCVEGDAFSTADSLADKGMRFAHTVNRWIMRSTMRERESFTEDFFREGRFRNLNTSNHPQILLQILRAYFTAADASRSAVRKLAGSHASTETKYFAEVAGEKSKRFAEHASERTKQLAAAAGTKSRQLAEAAGEKSKHLAEHASEKTKQLADAASEKSRELVKRVHEHRHDPRE